MLNYKTPIVASEAIVATTPHRRHPAPLVDYSSSPLTVPGATPLPVSPGPVIQINDSEGITKSGPPSPRLDTPIIPIACGKRPPVAIPNTPIISKPVSTAILLRSEAGVDGLMDSQLQLWTWMSSQPLNEVCAKVSFICYAGQRN